MLNRFINVFLTLSVVSSFLLADVFMTELTDPQNSSDAGRYVELYNNGDEDVDQLGRLHDPEYLSIAEFNALHWEQ